MDEYEALGAFFHQRERARRIVERQELQLRKAIAFDWITKQFAEGTQTYDFPDLIFYDDPLESLKSVEAEMERSK